MGRTTGKRIKKARQAAGLSQPELGRRVGKSTITVWRWEADQSEPPLTTLRKVADELRVPLVELIGAA